MPILLCSALLPCYPLPVVGILCLWLVSSACGWYPLPEVYKSSQYWYI